MLSYIRSRIVRVWRPLSLAAILTLTAWALAACGEAGQVITPAPEETPPPAAEGAIQVRMGEMYFEPNVITLKEGQQVTIEIINEGVILHEFMVGRGVHQEDGIAESFEQDLFEGVDVGFTGVKAELERKEAHGTEVMVEAGGKAILSFSVPTGKAGQWEIGCFVPGHYEAGMRGTLVVE